MIGWPSEVAMKEVYEETFKWIADHGIFADTGMGAGDYEKAVIRLM